MKNVKIQQKLRNYNENKENSTKIKKFLRKLGNLQKTKNFNEKWEI